MKSVSKAASYCDKSGLPIKYDWYCLSNQSAAVAAAVSNAFFLALAVVVKIVGIVIPTTTARIMITASNSTNVKPFLFNFFIFIFLLWYKVIILLGHCQLLAIKFYTLYDNYWQFPLLSLI